MHPAMAQPPILSVILPSDAGRMLNIQSHTVQENVTFSMENGYQIPLAQSSCRFIKDNQNCMRMVDQTLDIFTGGGNLMNVICHRLMKLDF